MVWRVYIPKCEGDLLCFLSGKALEMDNFVHFF